MEEVHGAPLGATRGGQGGPQAERWPDLMDMPFGVGGGLWGSRAKSGLVNLNPKERVLVNFMGGLSKRYRREGSRGPEQRSPRLLGEGHNRNSPVFVTLHVLQGGRGSGPGSHKLPGHTAWMLRHQYYKAV